MDIPKIKKIDIVVKYFIPVTAGIETNVLETYSVLAKKGWDITIHTSKDTALEKDVLPDSEIIRDLKIKRYHFGAFGFKPEIDWQNAGLICLHNFDIFPHFQILIRSLRLKMTGKKNFSLILTPHGGFNPEWSIFPFIQRVIKLTYHYTLGVLMINRVADGVRAVSEWEKEEMIKHGLKNRLISVISNGIEDEAFAKVDDLASKEIKERVRFLGRYIIQIGRIYPIKNYEATIRALPYLPEDINYVIAGPISDKRYHKRLIRLTKEFNVQNRVHFIGVVRGIDKYYLIKHAQAMVHMALWESFCNVLHEALSQGVVCVAANNTAIPYIIKDRINGFLVPTKDYLALANKLNNVISNYNSPEIQKIKDYNLIVGRKWSWRNVAGKMDELYRLKTETSPATGTKLVEHIVENNIPCIFVSPHIDDAILSAGDLISYLSDKTKVTVVNVFTSASDGKETLFTRRFLQLCGHKSGKELFNARKEEESTVMKKAGVKNINLDFIDGAWRKGGRYGLLSKLFGWFIPELNHLYPIHPLHLNSEKIAPQDKVLMDKISSELLTIAGKNKDAYIFCPLAIKSHIDHIIVRNVCSQNFKQVIYWSDFPYNPKSSAYKFTDRDFVNFEWEHNKDKKINLIMGYKSQIYPLFKNKKPSLVGERFYYMSGNMNMFGNKKPTVTVGIPAHNEEKNIEFLLTSIIHQNKGNYKLDRITVSCDGCTDNTAILVRRYAKKYKFIKVVESTKRAGKAIRLNNLYKNNKSDILITFDADSFLGTPDTIEKLVKKFNDPSVGLVGGNYMPFKIKTVFDRSTAIIHSLWNDIRTGHQDGYNIHNHLGCISALSKNFSRIAKIPEDITGDDCFVYAQAIQNGFRFNFTHEAFVYVNMPNSMRDYARQTSRFINNSQEMTDHFGDWVLEDINIPRGIKIKSILKMFFKEPVLLPLAIFLRTLVIIYRPFINKGAYKNAAWEPVKSSKIIYE